MENLIRIFVFKESLNLLNDHGSPFKKIKCINNFRKFKNLSLEFLEA